MTFFLACVVVYAMDLPWFWYVIAFWGWIVHVGIWCALSVAMQK